MARCSGYVRLLGLAAVGAWLLWPLAGSAEVATDGTLGAKVKLTGRDVQIPSRLGQVRGQNLFHSFERFGIATGNRVTFTGPDGLKNVIGRVTGGEASSIDGTLASRVRGADLWLLNPAGILFGPHARLDVPGSFHASTAAELRFEGGAVFSALDPSGGMLSVAAPEAFGFLGAKPPGGITVDQSVLEVPEGRTLALAGGEIGIAGGRLVAPAGTVALTAAATAGKVAVADGASTPGGADIRLDRGAGVDTRGDGGGTVRIRGGRITVTGASSVSADNTGAADATGGVTIAAGILDVGEGSGIGANALDEGNAGTVTVQAGQVELHDQARIVSYAFASGAAGKLTVQAGRIELGDRGEIASATIGTGDAGPVAVTADALELRHGSAVASDTFGAGKAGEVRVAAGHLLADGDDSGVFTGISSATDATTVGGQPFVATGDAGTVTVRADTIELRHVGVISSATFTAGNAGKVTVITGRLLIDGDDSDRLTGITSGADATRVNGQPLVSTGKGGEVTVTADTIELSHGGQIKSTTFGAGDAGTITVRTGRLLADGEGSRFPTGISSGTDLAFADAEPMVATGNAGRVAVRADAIELRGTGTIRTNTLGPGDAGRVAVDARTIALRDGGEISSATFGAGDAGRVAVSAGRLTVAEGGAVRTDSQGTSGAAGDVSIEASRLVVRDRGLIGSSSTGRGPAGNVRLAADTLEMGNASIRTVGTGSQGGAIAVTASDLIHLRNTEVTSNGILPEAGRSVITLQAPLIALNASRVTSLTGTGEPLAGSGLAQLFGGQTVISADSLVAASSSVTISGLESEIGSRLVAPEGAFLNAGDLLRESCAARRTGTASSFTAMGRGGLPPDPAWPLAGSYLEPGGATATDPVGPVLAASFGEGCKAAPGG